MTSLTGVKLLTLLNVTAIKRPRDLDKPGGHRASPVLSRTSSLQPSVNGGAAGDTSAGAGEAADAAAADAQANGSVSERPAKKRKSVVFGGELGPSGSTYKEKSSGKGKASMENGKQKGFTGSKTNGEANGSSGIAQEFLGLADLAEASDDEDTPAASSSATASSSNDMWSTRYDAASSLLQSDQIASAEKHEWSAEAVALQGYGRAVESRPGSSSQSSQQSDKAQKTRVTPALVSSLEKMTPEPLVSTCLNHLGTYKDFYLHSMDGEADGSKRAGKEEHVRGMRQAVMVHALNHVLKTRKRIVRNNEKLAHQAAADPNAVPEPPRDQSFTRPKVLFLLPLRSKALTYLKDNLFPLAPAGTQLENRNPFLSSFGTGNTPEDDEDERASRAGVPLDRIEDFHGNSDDNFRFGVKITRKAWRVVMPPANEDKLLECDLLFASPLGMKMMSEKEDDSTDLLSSIEVCVADGCDVMAMQNWDHVQFVFEHLNEIPRDPHGCDFSRIKPWYLEGQAKYLRQTILMSRYDMPEARAIFSRHCYNLAGKVRLDTPALPGVLGRVKSGVRQVFDRIDAPSEGGRGESAVEEVDRRLDFFTKKTIPDLLRSAVSRQRTIVIVPSYFDYVRLMNYLRKNDVVSYAAISEYSSDSEISRARVTFFKGKKDFLFVTERFHFYRRYKIRGGQTFVFYSPPERAQFYAEFLETPFLPSRKAAAGRDDAENNKVEPEDVRSVTLYSKFDRLRMERIVGKGLIGQMYSGEARYEFE